MRKHQRLLQVAAFVLLLLVSLAVVGCGSSGSSSSSGSSTEGSSSTGEETAVAPKDAAKGAPIKLGVVSPETGEAASPEFREGLEATAEYLNQDGGGIAGRPVELEICRTDGAPQGAINCANQLTKANVVAVLAGEDRSADAAFPIYERAGTPYISPNAVTNQQFVSPISIALSPGIPGGLAAIASYIKNEVKGTTSTTVVEQELPKALLEQFVSAPLGAAGIKNSFAFYSAKSPDLTPTIAAAAQDDPDALIVNVDNPQQCVPTMNAIGQQFDESTKVIQVGCNDEEVLEAAGSAAEGEVFVGYVDSALGVESPDVEQYERILEGFGSSESAGVNSALAASTLMTLKRVIEKQKPKSIEAKSIIAAFQGSSGVPIFMGPPLACGKAKIYPGLCNLDIRMFTMEGGSKKVLTGWFGGAEYLPR